MIYATLRLHFVVSAEFETSASWGMICTHSSTDTRGISSLILSGRFPILFWINNMSYLRTGGGFRKRASNRIQVIDKNIHGVSVRCRVVTFIDVQMQVMWKGHSLTSSTVVVAFTFNQVVWFLTEILNM